MACFYLISQREEDILREYLKYGRIDKLVGIMNQRTADWLGVIRRNGLMSRLEWERRNTESLIEYRVQRVKTTYMKDVTGKNVHRRKITKKRDSTVEIIDIIDRLK